MAKKTKKKPPRKPSPQKTHKTGPHNATVSVVMIAKDEEKYLSRALSSVVDWVDEIVLVDTGSTDRTVVIAQSFGAQVRHETWTGDFSYHRNQALEMASGDWCLQLDADEELEQSAAPLLRQLAAQSRGNGLNVTIKNRMPDGSVSAFTYPRFFRRLPEVRYFRKVHNQINIPGQIQASPIALVHHGYAAAEKELNKRHQRRLKMIRQWAVEEPQNWESHYYLSQTLVSRPESAEESTIEALKAIELCEKNQLDFSQSAKAYLTLLQGLNQLERHEESLRFAQVWAGKQPQNPDPRLYAARAFFGLEKWPETAMASREFVMLNRDMVRDPQLAANLSFANAGQLFSVLVIWCLAEAKLARREQAAEIIMAIRNLPNPEMVLDLLRSEAAKLGVEPLVMEAEAHTFRSLVAAPQAAKPHRILSLYFGHDANLCLMENGKPLLVLEKERVSRVKHDQGQMMDILPGLLQQHGWSPDSIDLVVINPFSVPDRQKRAFNWEVSGSFFTQQPDYEAPNWAGPASARTSSHHISLWGQRIECLAVDHHLAHAALAFFTSPFAEAGILSADGGGDQRYLAEVMGKGNKLEWIEYDWREPRGQDHSLANIGSLWANIGQQHFGYQRLEGAGKLMGLASYGSSSKKLEELLLRHLRFYWPYPLPLDLLGQPSQQDPRSEFSQNLCAALQEVTSRLYLEAAGRMSKSHGANNLCLTGGCAMNCITNTVLHSSGLFSGTYVPAQPHDGGLALGQALYAWHHVLDQPRKPGYYEPYLGTDLGPAPLHYVEEIVAALERGEVVALAHGKAESGPRALGHRSILADARNPKVRGLINNQIKNREWFRPFAPMVLSEEMERLFDVQVPSWYMSYIVGVKDEHAMGLPGVVHVDQTARPQVVEAGHDPMTRSVLQAWKDKTGLGVLLNTSFNSQEPLVDSLEHALSTFQRTNLDMLVTPRGLERK